MLESFYGNSFTYKKLTEEEQQKRGILGRLVGVIADSKQPTRNGRIYSKKLWENVFNDPITQEKIDKRVFFGELDHPVDRETVDSSKIAICLAEKPKFAEDGKLYGVFDILNTPNGKILKTLCDYGSDIGVSSRGTGDLINDDEVDPDTYYCECFDAVLIPAVKDARPKFVTESLDVKNNGMKKALLEAYNAAEVDDKKIMKETLDKLNINLNEDVEKVTIANEEDVPEVPSNVLIEEDEATEEETVVEEPIGETTEEEKTKEENTEKVEEEIKEESSEIESNKEQSEIESDTWKVKNLLDDLKQFDKDLEIEFKAVSIDANNPEQEDEIKDAKLVQISYDSDKDPGKLVIELGYNLPLWNYNIKAEDEPASAEDESSIEEPATEEPVETKEEATDSGDLEVIENLKEAIRQNNSLNEKIHELENQKTVSDTEVRDLKEALEKYKLGFQRMSELASKATKLEQENKNLVEQLNNKSKNYSSLTESVNASERKVKALSEKLMEVQTILDNKENELTEQLSVLKNKYQERTNLAKSYKDKYLQVLEQYISNKASMLGVRPSDITRRLNENYTLEDVDKICNDLLNVDRPQFSLKGYGKPSVRINESKVPVKSLEPESGYEIDDDLLIWAGLK